VEPAGSTFFFFVVVFLLLAPLYKAGNRPIPLLLLELGAVGFLFTLIRYGAVHAALTALPTPLTIALGVLSIYPLVQLVPLPEALWRLIPGHAEYATVLERFASSDALQMSRAISFVPSATEAGWLALLPPLACFLAVQWLHPGHVVRLLLAMTIVAGAEALLGLLQVRAGRESIFYWLSDIAYGTASGTFVNHNHFAAMMAMMLPVIVGLIVFTIRFGRRRIRPPVFAFDPDALPQRIIIFVTAVLMLLALFFSGSRAGIATALAGLAFSSVLLARARAGLRHANLIVGALVIVGIAVAGLIGISPLLSKITPEQLGLSGQGRIALSAATLRAAIDFLPFGSGLSTFADVFPRYQVEVFGGFIDHAHNDYLQFFMETGLAAPVVIALALAAYVMRMSELLRLETTRSFIVLQIAAGVGLLPMILHSMFDFAIHMPSNAMWFAALAGIMFHPVVEEGPMQKERPRAAAPRQLAPRNP
jgi:O-antigen ligase